MDIRRLGRLVMLLTLLGTVALPAGAQDFREAQYVSVLLGAADEEQGIRRVDGPPDGRTEAAPQGGRSTVAIGTSGERAIYFDVHDSYIYGGFNQVVMTVIYEDVGLAPIDLEYDAYDVVDPSNMADSWVKKRVSVAERTNSGAVKTAWLSLEDARFGNNQQGGADFRLVSAEDFVVRSLSAMRSFDPVKNLPIRVVVNGQEVIFADVAPVIENDSLLVPMRPLFHALGVRDEEIRWDETARTVTAKKGQTTIVLQIESGVAWVGGKAVRLNQPAIIRDGRTLIPLRFVSETLGLTVRWDDHRRLITISPQPPKP